VRNRWWIRLPFRWSAALVTSCACCFSLLSGGDSAWCSDLKFRCGWSSCSSAVLSSVVVFWILNCRVAGLISLVEWPCLFVWRACMHALGCQNKWSIS
jgi:hypothetical protein